METKNAIMLFLDTLGHASVRSIMLIFVCFRGSSLHTCALPYEFYDGINSRPCLLSRQLLKMLLLYLQLTLLLLFLLLLICFQQGHGFLTNDFEFGIFFHHTFLFHDQQGQRSFQCMMRLLGLLRLLYKRVVHLLKALQFVGEMLLVVDRHLLNLIQFYVILPTKKNRNCDEKDDFIQHETNCIDPTFE